MRRAGILMPITSLPSPYGIGTMGRQQENLSAFYIRQGSHIGRYCPYVLQVMEIHHINHFLHMPEIHI